MKLDVDFMQKILSLPRFLLLPVPRLDLIVRRDPPAPVEVPVPFMLSNHTLYDVRYVTLQNVKREMAVITALLALDSLPVFGWIAAVAEMPIIIARIAKLARTAAKVKQILTDKQVIPDDLDLVYLRTNTIPPTESREWFTGGLQTVEALLQIVSCTDAQGSRQFIGWSMIVEPQRRSYESHMDQIYFDDQQPAADWGTINLGALNTLVTWLEKIKEIIQAIRGKLLLQAGTSVRSRPLEGIRQEIMQAQDIQALLRNFKTWCEQQQISLVAQGIAHLQLDASVTESSRQTAYSAAPSHESLRVAELIALIDTAGGIRRLERRANHLYTHSLWPLWPGLAVVIDVPNANTLPIVPSGGTNPAGPFVKAVGDEVGTRTLPGGAIWGKGATLFLHAAHTQTTPSVSVPTSLYAEKIHVHLPSLYDAAGNSCPPGKGYSFWKDPSTTLPFGLQENDLSDAGWCVNYEYKAPGATKMKKYKLQNSRDIFYFDSAAKAFLANSNGLAAIGHFNQAVHALFSEQSSTRRTQPPQPEVGVSRYTA